MKKFVLFFLLLLYAYGYSQILIPNIPGVSGGSIKAFEFDSATKKLYIVGDFTQVGSVLRKGFAVIDITTGNVLNDFPTLNIDNSNLATGNFVEARMKIHKNKLYIGGAFNAYFGPTTNWIGYLFALDLATRDSLGLYYDAPLSDFKIYNSRIYTSGSYQFAKPDEYMVSELDTLGNILWQKSISNNISEELRCVEVRNNNLYVGGIFSSFGGLPRNNIAKIDLNTHTITTWSLSPQPGIPTPGCFGVSNIVAYPNDVLADLYHGSCTAQYNLAFYNTGTGTRNTNYTTIAYLGDFPNLLMENDTSFWYFNSAGLKLRGLTNYTAPWAPTSNGYLEPFFRKDHYLFVAGPFTTLEGATHQGLGIYCLAPKKPVAQTFSSSVCKKQSNVVYSVAADPEAVSYTWTYAGLGITINGSGTNVSLDFSSTANSGNLNVIAYNSCGIPSSTLSIPITVHVLPVANAGADIHFTCTHTSDALNGFPNNSALCQFNWNGPGGYSSTSAYNTVLSSSITSGTYIFMTTAIATGCKNSDTLQVLFDTLRPIVNHLNGNFLLSCKANSLVLSASGNYPVNDSLHWSGTSFSQNDPATVTSPGTYILTITSGANGCKNKDNVTVTRNITPPGISVPVSADTITCIKDSVQLHAISSNTNAILYWKDGVNDSLFNNSYIRQASVYSAHAIDTINGCTSQSLFVVSQFTTPPVVYITPGNYSFNCSYDSTTLSGGSPNMGAALQWTGPAAFSSGNPATVHQSGMYILTVTHPQNGCTAEDSVLVTLKNVLLLNISADTTICNGGIANFSVAPIGGTPGFSYSWNNGGGNTQVVTTTLTDTTRFIVTVSDNAGCIGKDSIQVNVPSPINDSISTFIPCDPNHPTGQIQVFLQGGVQPYSYSLNSSLPQASPVFPNLAFGSYTVRITDAMGCSAQTSAVIENSSLLPSPDFILSTGEIKGDTFVIVDISNPRPDSIVWQFPVNCQLINSNAYAPQIINSDTGALQITMLAWFGTCQMSLTKNIHVKDFDTAFATDNNNNGIKDITLYPNPNTGHFTIDISLCKKQVFSIFIFDATGNELLRMPYNNIDFISTSIDLPNPVPGTYLLKVIAEYDSRSKTFLISQ